MRHITQGETAYFVLRPGLDWLPSADEAEVRFVDPSGRTALLFSTGGKTGAQNDTQPIAAHRNGLLSFVLTPEQTARLEGRYRIEIRIACSGSAAIRSRWAVRVRPSTYKTKND